MKFKTPNFKFFIFSLTFLLFFNACANKEGQLQSLAYLNSPKLDDVYFVDLGRGEFSLMKISSILNDSIYFLHNKHVIDQRQFFGESNTYIKNERVDYIDQSSYYSDSIIKYSSEELLEQFAVEKIYKVKRVVN